VEIFFILAFLFYILFPVNEPANNNLACLVHSPLGILSMFIINVYLFMKSPILGSLFIFVSYKLLRKNQKSIPSFIAAKYSIPITPYITNHRKDIQPVQHSEETEIEYQLDDIFHSNELDIEYGKPNVTNEMSSIYYTDYTYLNGFNSNIDVAPQSSQENITVEEIVVSERAPIDNYKNIQDRLDISSV